MPPADPRSPSNKDKAAVHSIAEADAALARIAARLSSDFFFRTAALVSELADGDLMEGLILRSIIAGNTNHLDSDPRQPRQYTSLDDPIPDELRRPISVLAVASGLGLPYETTRRYVNRLLKAGLCVRKKGGVVAVGGTVAEGPAFRRSLLANMANIRRFHAALKLAGIV
jgi:hypothetical protein